MTAKTKNTRYHVPSVERTLAIIELLAAEPRGLCLNEIVERLGFPDNSIYRITVTLLSHGYLHRHEDTKRFTLTRKLLLLSHAALTEVNLMEVSLDILRALREELKETVLLCALVDNEGVVLEQMPSTHAFKLTVEVGSRFPLHTAAPSKGILAFLPGPELEGLLASMKLTRYTEQTITSKKSLREELEKVRQQGYAVDRGEMITGSHCIGAPILDQNHYPIAGVTITGPADRLPAKEFPRLGAIVRQYANRISQRLGNGALRPKVQEKKT